MNSIVVDVSTLIGLLKFGIAWQITSAAVYAMHGVFGDTSTPTGNTPIVRLLSVHLF